MFPETLDATDVSALLKAEPETILQLARRGILPGARIGKSWVFLRDDVLGFLRSQIAEETAERRERARMPSVLGIVVKTAPKGRRTILPVLPGMTEGAL